MDGYGGPITEAGTPPLLLIHRSPGNGDVWNNVAAALSVETEVLKPTLAGHCADRETPITDIEVLAIAIQLEALFSEKHQAVDVVGHSFGGVVALRLGAPSEIVDPPSVIAGTRRHLYLSCNGGHGNT